MSRIDVATLVMAFEKRISHLEKNPPDKVSTGVIIKMLESSIDSLIKEHFAVLVKKEMETILQKEFKQMKKSFVRQTIKNILTDSYFKEELENKLMKKLINAL